MELAIRWLAREAAVRFLQGGPASPTDPLKRAGLGWFNARSSSGEGGDVSIADTSRGIYALNVAPEGPFRWKRRLIETPRDRLRDTPSNVFSLSRAAVILLRLYCSDFGNLQPLCVGTGGLELILLDLGWVLIL